jgi:hypothetical protein
MSSCQNVHFTLFFQRSYQNIYGVRHKLFSKATVENHSLRTSVTPTVVTLEGHLYDLNFL